MIKKIDLYNFQIYENLNTFLFNDVNFIIGTSDIGKSTIIRAICWVAGLINGSSKFIHKKHNKCYVTLYLENEIHITKYVSHSSSITYKLKTPTYEKIFEKCGTNVPEEIKNILNLKDINVQFQFDPHFLFTKTSTDIYNILNSHFGFSDWDNLQKYNTKKLNEIKQSRKLLFEQYVEKLNYIEKEKETIEKLEYLIKRFDSLQKKKEELITYKESLKKYIIFLHYNILQKLLIKKYIYKLTEILIYTYLKLKNIKKLKNKYIQYLIWILLQKKYLLVILQNTIVKKELINNQKKLIAYIRLKFIDKLISTYKYIYLFSLFKRWKLFIKLKQITNYELSIHLLNKYSYLNKLSFYTQKEKELLIQVYIFKKIEHLQSLNINLQNINDSLNSYLKLKQNNVCPLCGNLIIKEKNKNE